MQLYLYLFPLKKLFKEVCVKRENKKNTLFFYKPQIECLKRVKYKYPEYSQKIEKYSKLDQWINRIILISISIIFLLWLFGLIEYKPSKDAFVTKTEKITVTKIESNKTTVIEYKNLKDFFK